VCRATDGAMTEWDAAAYRRISALQRWVAEKSLAGLRLDGSERALDVGCGDGSITAQLAGRLPRGSVVGVDASQQMIALATKSFPPAAHPNLRFQVADAAQLPFADAFDLIVSFNCLHWVRDQAAALRGLRNALAPTGRAHLRFVPAGARRSLEDVIEDTRRSPAWSAYFPDYRAPYVHLTRAECARMARDAGLHVERFDVEEDTWDFRSRDAFVCFAEATFVEWTRLIPPAQHAAFIGDVLDRLRAARRWLAGAGERLQVLSGAGGAAPSVTGTRVTRPYVRG
jgi:trans-aconitate 2-methyltransferase